ncbi:MAG: hypothetical protein AAB392_01110 [Patescibacteria group bacterium]
MSSTKLVTPLTVGLIQSIVASAGDITDYIIKNEEDKKGGVLYVGDSKTGLPLLSCVFGSLTEEKITKYKFFATEKAERLAKTSWHDTSWQSRDMDTDPKGYAGAVRVNGTEGFILSFSGFTEEQDEAAMLVLAMNIGLMNGEAAALLVQMSKNQYFCKLQNNCVSLLRRLHNRD